MTLSVWRCFSHQGLIVERLNQALQEISEQQRRFARVKQTMLAEKAQEVELFCVSRDSADPSFSGRCSSFHAVCYCYHGVN